MGLTGNHKVSPRESANDHIEKRKRLSHLHDVVGEHRWRWTHCRDLAEVASSTH